jgi:hypothetical protein
MGTEQGGQRSAAGNRGEYEGQHAAAVPVSGLYRRLQVRLQTRAQRCLLCGYELLISVVEGTEIAFRVCKADREVVKERAEIIGRPLLPHAVPLMGFPGQVLVGPGQVHSPVACPFDCLCC